MHEVETSYINLWAEAGAYGLEVNTPVSAALTRQKLDLVDVNFVLKTGEVIRSDMIGERGLWIVHGTTADEEKIELKIAVRSSEYDVELLQVVKL